MSRYKSVPTQQPELISEPRGEYTVPPEQQAEKEAYRERLSLHLKDPAFRQIEGFPIGEDEAIMALSDPPYYTACPNPFLAEIIAGWQQEREAMRQKLGLRDESYQRDPFTADVSEGKNHPIYNAHSYHTKVPHKAIMRYILHYTDPGDIVFDGFCGTGMTGVAAQSCANPDSDFKLTVERDMPKVKWGGRKAILGDLSPAATFIAYNFLCFLDPSSREPAKEKVTRNPILPTVLQYITKVC